MLYMINEQVVREKHVLGWDTRATDSIIKSAQKDTEASITLTIKSGKGGGGGERFLLGTNLW